MEGMRKFGKKLTENSPNGNLCLTSPAREKLVFENFRSGNSRLLAKSFDQLGHPLAVLDRRGAIAFVNSAMCAMIKADATQLVGQSSSWQIPADDEPFAALRTALAPPAGALQGKVVSRQLTTPIVFGSIHTGQLFVPLLDNDGSVEATLVVLGNWQEISAQVHTARGSLIGQKPIPDSTLAQIRSRWQTLDGLHSLIGTSPAIQLAMTRAQLAMGQPCGLLVSGRRGTGTTEVVRGVFMGRLKKAGLNRIAGQLFPVNCSLLEVELLDGMLEVMASRLRPEAQSISQLLVLEQLEDLSEAGLPHLVAWLDNFDRQCTVAATSSLGAEQLAAKSHAWRALVSRIATIEISLPPLCHRSEDISLLATHFLAQSCQHKNRAPLTFTSEALQLLTAFPWPENLTQLAQAIDDAVNHAVLVSSIQVNHLPVAVRTFASTGLSTQSQNFEPIDLDQVLLDLERTIVMRALKLLPRNRAAVARLLGISRARLLRRIEQLGLNSD